MIREGLQTSLRKKVFICNSGHNVAKISMLRIKMGICSDIYTVLEFMMRLSLASTWTYITRSISRFTCVIYAKFKSIYMRVNIFYITILINQNSIASLIGSMKSINKVNWSTVLVNSNCLNCFYFISGYMRI